MSGIALLVDTFVGNITIRQVTQAIATLNPNKAQGCDLIRGKILTQLPTKALVLLISIYNSILRTGYHPLKR